MYKPRIDSIAVCILCTSVCPFVGSSHMAFLCCELPMCEYAQTCIRNGRFCGPYCRVAWFYKSSQLFFLYIYIKKNSFIEYPYAHLYRSQGGLSGIIMLFGNIKQIFIMSVPTRSI